MLYSRLTFRPPLCRAPAARSRQPARRRGLRHRPILPRRAGSDVCGHRRGVRARGARGPSGAPPCHDEACVSGVEEGRRGAYRRVEAVGAGWGVRRLGRCQSRGGLAGGSSGERGLWFSWTVGGFFPADETG